MIRTLLLLLLLPLAGRGQTNPNTAILPEKDNDVEQHSSALEEIVLTGSARATTIRENPVAITSVSAHQIERSTETNIIDALVKNVPGLKSVKTGPNISKPFIHGLGYNRVLTLFDGMRQEGQQYGDEHGLEIDGYHLEKAEVIKGPASLLYGSDAIAGVISFFPVIPKRNDATVAGRFLTEYHSNNNLLGSALRLDYAEKRFFFAAHGSLKMAKNYRNAIDGRVYLTNFTEKHFAVQSGFRSDKGYTRLNFTLYDNVQGIPDGSRDPVTRKFTQQIFEEDEDDLLNRPVVSERDLNSYKVPDLAQHIQHYRVYLHSVYEAGRGDFDLLLGGQQNVRREFTHPTEPTQAGMFMRLNTFNYGLRYNAPKISDFELSLGLNGMLQNNKNKDATDFPIPNYQLYEGGIYVYSKWKRRGWTVSGGMRFDLRQMNWNDFFVAPNPVTGFEQQSNAEDPSVALQFEAFRKTYYGLSGSLGATLQLNKHLNVKANVGRAYRAPTITEIGSNGLDPGAHIIYLGNRGFKPEFSLQQDLGIHLKHKNISGELSFFNNNIQNFIYMASAADEYGNALVDAQGNRTYQYEQSEAWLFGGEVWVALHPRTLKGFRWDTALSVVYGYNQAKEFRKSGSMGAYLPLLPPLQVTSNVSQEIKLNAHWLTGLTAKVETEYAAAQNRYLGLNGTETPTPSYSLYHVGLTADLKYARTKTAQLVFQINNIFDTAYQSHLNRLKYFEYDVSENSGPRGIYNMGRNMALKLIVTF